MIKEFKEFALRGNVLDMAIGIIIGTAFGAIVQSLVADVIMPPLGILLGHVDFSSFFIILKEGSPSGPYLSLSQAKAAGAVTINYGMFINTVIRFLIVSIVVFFVVKNVNKMKRKEKVLPAQPTTKQCLYCFSFIPHEAVKCPFCTSDLSSGTQSS